MIISVQTTNSNTRGSVDGRDYNRYNSEIVMRTKVFVSCDDICKADICGVGIEMHHALYPERSQSVFGGF